jgi:hypothetical protein
MAVWLWRKAVGVQDSHCAVVALCRLGDQGMAEPWVRDGMCLMCGVACPMMATHSACELCTGRLWVGASYVRLYIPLCLCSALGCVLRSIRQGCVLFFQGACLRAVYCTIQQRRLVCTHGHVGLAQHTDRVAAWSATWLSAHAASKRHDGGVIRFKWYDASWGLPTPVCFC